MPRVYYLKMPLIVVQNSRRNIIRASDIILWFDTRNDAVDVNADRNYIYSK